MTDVTDPDERMQRRVQTLLESAENFSRHGEDGSAQAALALAAEIMMKHSIDAAVIAARRAAGAPPDEKIVQKVVPFKGIYKTALVLQFHAFVAAYTNTVRTFTSKDDKVEHLHLVGYESEVRQLAMLITSVQLQAIASLNVWWKGDLSHRQLTGMVGYKTRRQYVSSFVRGATDRVEVARRTALDDSAPGTELVLRNRRTAVDEYVNATFKLFTRRSNLAPGSVDAETAGREAGRRANTGDTPVGNDRRQITS